MSSTPRLGTTDRRATQRAIEMLYAARFNADEATYLSFFSPQVRLNSIGNPVLQNGGGERHGHRGLAAYLALVHAKTHFGTPVIEDVMASGNRLAVRWAADMAQVDTGKAKRHSALDIMRIENGQIVDMLQFIDVEPSGMIDRDQLEAAG